MPGIGYYKVLEFKECLINDLASEMASDGKDPSSTTTHTTLNDMI